MKTIPALLSFLVATLFLSSCAKKTGGPVYFTHGEVPALHVGNWWKYELSDSLTHTLDTPTITIAALYHAGSTDSAICFVSHQGVVIDTAFMTVRDSSVTFRSLYLAGYTMRLPCTAGDVWRGLASANDTVTALSVTATSDGTICQLHELVNTPDAYASAYTQMQSNVGMTEYSIYSYSFFGVNRHFGLRLLDHHLN